MPTDPRIVTGNTTGLWDDIKPGFVAIDPSVSGVENMMKSGAATPDVYRYASYVLQSVTPGWKDYANELLDSIELQFLSHIQDCLKSGARPVEVYRLYHKDLRCISLRNGDCSYAALDLLRDLYLEQTQPDNELSTPYHLDSYTGELIVDLDDVIPSGKHQVKGLKGLLQDIADMDTMAEQMDKVAPVKVSEWNHYLTSRAPDVAKALGWDKKTVAQFLKANSEFVGSEYVEEEPLDDRGYVPPTLEKDFDINRAAFAEFSLELKGFHRQRSQLFNAMRKDGIDPRDWHSTFRRRFTKTPEYGSMVDAIERTCLLYGPETAAAIFYKVEGDYGVSLKDIAAFRIPPSYASPFSRLGDFIDEYGDDILDLVADASPTNFPAQESAIDKFSEDTLNILSSSLPEIDSNPLRTRSFVIAAIRSISSGADLQHAEDIALDEWRRTMSPAAADAYNIEFARTQDRKAAMRAFWRMAPPTLPRPKAKIASIRGDKQGLVLDGGRRIDWNIAILKLKSNELDLDAAQSARLKSYLAEHKIGKEFAVLL